MASVKSLLQRDCSVYIGVDWNWLPPPISIVQRSLVTNLVIYLPAWFIPRLKMQSFVYSPTKSGKEHGHILNNVFTSDVNLTVKKLCG